MSRTSHWHLVKLKEVCDDITVGHVGPMANEYVKEGIPFLRSQNIQPFRISRDDIKFIPREFHSRLRKSSLRPSDLAVVRTGYPGTACVIPPDLPVSNCADLVIIRPSNKINSHFLAAIFNSTWGRSLVAGNLVGVAQQHFNIGAAKELTINLPPIRVQNAIADILCSYTDLIENNTRRIAILESMAQALYQEWFVRFRCPGHEKIPLVSSPLGDIPEGWKVVTVDEAINVNPRTTVPRDGDKPFVPMGAVPQNSMLIDVPSVEMRSGNSGSKFKNGDTLFARITPCLENGKTAFVSFLPSDDAVAFGSTEFIVLRSRTVCPEFVYLLARSDAFRDNAIKSMSGATGRQRVQEKCFDKFFFPHPDPQTLTSFSTIAHPIFQAVFTLAKKNDNLRRTRDLLLPRLISGQIDVEHLDIDVVADLVGANP